MSVSDDIITIPQPALLVASGPADQCQCVLSLCVGWLPVVTAFYLPHCLGNSSLGSVRVWIHHPPLTATVTLPLPAKDTVHP
ncbi:unnamed protein product [Staurois parvus]|uniref:Uncharacterized protein n=1 Tax=Staurois parvus TaxID=386267 RepID=A0ABN9E1H2_9NEOB|nr:unnamed protein product [Staurois parvus]